MKGDNLYETMGLVRIAEMSAEKGAVLEYTMTVAIYCARAGHNIRCNSINPCMPTNPTTHLQPGLILLNPRMLPCPVMKTRSVNM